MRGHFLDQRRIQNFQSSFALARFLHYENTNRTHPGKLSRYHIVGFTFLVINPERIKLLCVYQGFDDVSIHELPNLPQRWAIASGGFFSSKILNVGVFV